jgi:hypothetical protein
MKQFTARQIFAAIMGVLLTICVFGSSPALAQTATNALTTRPTFSIGSSLGGQGSQLNFSTTPIQFPSNFGISLRLEWLDFLAQSLSLRADLGSQALEIGPMWRLDLSDVVNLTLSMGLGLFDWSGLGLYGRFGFEYRFLPELAATLEFGARSKFITGPNAMNLFNISWLLGVVYFL